MPHLREGDLHRHVQNIPIGDRDHTRRASLHVSRHNPAHARRHRNLQLQRSLLHPTVTSSRCNHANSHAKQRRTRRRSMHTNSTIPTLVYTIRSWLVTNPITNHGKFKIQLYMWFGHKIFSRLNHREGGGYYIYFPAFGRGDGSRSSPDRG